MNKSSPSLFSLSDRDRVDAYFVSFFIYFDLMRIFFLLSLRNSQRLCISVVLDMTSHLKTKRMKRNFPTRQKLHAPPIFQDKITEDEWQAIVPLF